MANTIGTDSGSLTSATGGVVNVDGQPLLAADNDGATSRILGQALQREIQAGVANGDFSFPPSDADANVDNDTNPLPYWTSAVTGEEPTITAAITTAATAAGQCLTFTTGADEATGNAFTLTRYVPIAGNANRNTAYQAELFAITGTGTTTDRQRVRATLSIESVDKDYAPLTVSSSLFTVANELNDQSLTTYWITPDATAAYLLLTVEISIPSTAPEAEVTLPVTEVRLNRGDSSIAFPNATDPTNSTWIISAQDDAADSQLLISNVDDLSGTYPSIGLTEGGGNAGIALNANDGGTIALTTGVGGLLTHTGDEVVFDNSSPLSGGVFTVNMDGSSGGIGAIDLIGTTDVDGNLSTNGVLTATNLTSSGSITVNSGGDVILQADGSDVYVQDTNAANGTNPRLLFRDKNGTFYAGLKSGAANVVQVLNGSATTDYAQLWAERIYPMNGSTASRYISDNGTRTEFSAGIETNGSIVTVGSIVNSSISTTTQTASAAIWVLSSGSTYSLRRNSSSQRYKTNITDVDQVVIDAAKRIKPRHYESTIEDEAGATRLGFIAEEVEAAGLTHAVGYDAEGRPESLDSIAMIAALYSRVEDLEKRLEALAPTPSVRYDAGVPNSSVSD
jgi:hypothetical protein